MPKQKPSSSPVVDWHDKPELQAELAKVLDTPVLVRAFEHLLHTALPRTEPIIRPVAGVSAQSMDSALAYAYKDAAGFVRFYDRLHALTRPKQKADAPAYKKLKTEDEA